MVTVTDFIFLGSQMTVVSDCSHEVKRHLLLGGKAMKKIATMCMYMSYQFSSVQSLSRVRLFATP